MIRRQSAPPARVYRAKLALLLHGPPARDNAAAGRRPGKHANGGRSWRKARATEGFRRADKGGRGRKPVSPPAAGGEGEGVGVREPRAA